MEREGLSRAIAVAALVLSIVPLSAQTRRAPAKKPAAAAALKKEAPEYTCPTPLGVGVTTRISFCEVAIGRDPAGGILVKLPPHRGPVTLTFDLHNRHTYSEEDVRANRAYARYTAGIGVLEMDNTLISRAAVISEFRSAKDLLDRIGGGAGPSGVKAVAPLGDEKVTIAIPETDDEVSILGEKLAVERQDGTTNVTQQGRLIAAVSNLMIEYRPGPPPRKARKK
ncbi:MAG TPA: hypothetical protein VFA59_05680 [Vicinamibacterales bacterium]|nr:hypothetical protein [Vicinamibacterales bacterium]